MLRLLSLLALFFALFLPLFLPKSKVSGNRRQNQTQSKVRPSFGKLAGLLLMPFMPRWIQKAVEKTARAVRGPSCPRCGQKVGRQMATCHHCGNLMATVRYTVEKSLR